MKKIVTFGEVMLRLAPTGHSKFSQTDHLQFTFGGGEANVAIALAYMGVKAQHVTCFPDNILGKTATQFLRRHWVNTSHVYYHGQEMGIYFLEQGAVHRSSAIVYDRSHSSFATTKSSIYQWKKILQTASWFHWTGITPALSQHTYDATIEAVKSARELDITISADLALRKNLWQYTKDPEGSLQRLVQFCDVIIAGSRELNMLLNTEDNRPFMDQAKAVMQKFPAIKLIADKERISKNASVNTIKGKLWNGKEEIYTEPLEVTHIIDRVGTGDAYAAGLIYGLLQEHNHLEALNFAVASCALKHTIEGDANMVTADEVYRLAGGDTSGRIIR